jgi:hypothetical protein
MIIPKVIYHERLTGAVGSGLIFISKTYIGSRYVLRHELRHTWQYTNKRFRLFLKLSMLNRNSWVVIPTTLLTLLSFKIPTFVLMFLSMCQLLVELDAANWACKRSKMAASDWLALLTYIIHFSGTVSLYYSTQHKLFILVYVLLEVVRTKIAKYLS